MYNISTFWAYIRQPPNNDEAPMATLCMNAAVEYLTNAGVAAQNTSSLYELAVYMLAGHWYENRGTQMIGISTADLDRSVQSIVYQLRGGDQDGT